MEGYSVQVGDVAHGGAVEAADIHGPVPHAFDRAGGNEKCYQPSDLGATSSTLAPAYHCRCGGGPDIGAVIDGIQATAQITVDPAKPGARVLILTTFDLDEYVYAALRAGASGFMLKDTSPEELLVGIRVVAAGDGLLSPA